MRHVGKSMKQHSLQATAYMLWQLQEFLKARGIVINGTTVIQQAAVTQLSDNNSECPQGSQHPCMGLCQQLFGWRT